jgi:hypothetical protein
MGTAWDFWGEPSLKRIVKQVGAEIQRFWRAVYLKVTGPEVSFRTYLKVLWSALSETLYDGWCISGI